MYVRAGENNIEYLILFGRPMGCVSYHHMMHMIFISTKLREVQEPTGNKILKVTCCKLFCQHAAHSNLKHGRKSRSFRIACF